MKDNVNNNVAVSHSGSLICSASDSIETPDGEVSCDSGNLKVSIFVSGHDRLIDSDVFGMRGDGWRVCEFNDDNGIFTASYVVVEFDDADDFTHEKFTDIKQKILAFVTK